ncbi:MULTISPECIES: exodeoxyribonuclease VII small subunit [Salinivibrio]|jgi:Exodeoxyribonuclease VII small subunit (EC 3.1.11.6)|uniref:Exodeoxyribonuclease 7 small subunit n=1 Tax=Salinivibrio siamensis TaxID=414286 RepID=A0ABX3K8J4_9GAMM|nr:MULTISPECIES: exodeoxyribonuclease VII small subunit [Salinivibrio]KKA46316.1 exodeoxyribonuclease VII small subunit [Salinivibrio sp. KP-1]MPS31780.1 exodeoxyribonuclease VII small subunit [Salinivibrio sp. VYel7]MPX91572.1 exodeoxyribonuclease VII small subunit [Salinivibrio sp. VYel1]MPX93174.1 exodeoxyribonuclease VII small subunit [Salinivibrio sp. VYel9]MPX95999.1 exodeoxyribonuclease VII small subunit [Salinivibrio sp. VYel6]
MAVKKPENMTFEDTLKELDSIVGALESGELPLDTAMKRFERGIALTRQGQKTLADAEQRVEILLSQEDDGPLTEFSPQDDD